MSSSDSNAYPAMVGAGETSPATHEIHIFLAPVNPDEETLAKYFAAVDLWNETQFAGEEALITTSKMKACHLSLEYLSCAIQAQQARSEGTETHTHVRVMQSARFVYDNEPAKVIEAAHRDASWFEKQGLQVVREKIEASAYGNKGIPQTNEAATEHPGCYFEFHVKITGDSLNPLHLRQLADRFSDQYRIPVPFSRNLNPNQFGQDNQGSQQYLNMRFRLTGLDNAKQAVASLKSSITEDPQLAVPKIISEYVWFDTNVGLDKGWIDEVD